jgi:MFS family permease
MPASTVMVAAAVAAALIAVLAFAGKMSGRLGDRTVDRLYYASYALMALGILLMAMQGLFAARQ